MSVFIRQGDAGDAGAVAAIHEAAVLTRGATFRTVPRSEEAFTEAIAGERPFLVAERDGEVVGWASASAYELGNPFYDGVAECAVYVAEVARGRGIGRLLLDELALSASASGIFKLVAKVFSTNEASLRLFDSAGYSTVGVHRRHGQVDGEWKDVVVLERHTGADERPS